MRILIGVSEKICIHTTADAADHVQGRA